MTETIDTAALAKLATTMFEACAICVPSQRGRMLEYFTAEQWRALAALLRGVVDGPKVEPPERKVLRDLLAWTEQRCPCKNEEPNPCPLCGASVENLEACKSAENTFPPRLLEKVRIALSTPVRSPAPPLSTTKEG